MAKDYSSIITLGAIGAAVWYAYEQGWFSSLLGTAAAPAVASPIVSAPVTSSPVVSSPVVTTAAPPTVTSTSPAGSSMAAQLQSAAGSVPTLNADQWSYYWNQLNLPAVNPTTWQTTFFPNGRPSNPDSNPEYTSQQYVSALESAGVTGLSGFGNYFGIPAGAIHGGW